MVGVSHNLELVSFELAIHMHCHACPVAAALLSLSKDTVLNVLHYNLLLGTLVTRLIHIFIYIYGLVQTISSSSSNVLCQICSAQNRTVMLNAHIYMFACASITAIRIEIIINRYEHGVYPKLKLKQQQQQQHPQQRQAPGGDDVTTPLEECVQEVGDLIYVPEGWWHSTLNTGNGVTLSVY